MFCNNCGNELKDSSAFCHICGSKIVKLDELEQQTYEVNTPNENINAENLKNIGNTLPQGTVNNAQVLPSSSSMGYYSTAADNSVYRQYANVNPKKKTYTPLVVIGIIVTTIIIVIIIAAINHKSIDYIGVVKNHTPYYESEGFSCSIGDVLDQYMDSPHWRDYQSGGTTYVKVEGDLTGLNAEAEIIFTVDVEENERYVIPKSILLYGTDKYTGNDAFEFLYEMFYAYNLGYSTLSQYISS